MDGECQELPLRELGPGAGRRRPQQPQPARVTLESPALEVMTDLACVSPATIRPQAPLEGANLFMISRGVRLLLPQAGEVPRTFAEIEAALGR